MRVTVEYDASCRAYVVRHEAVHLTSLEHIDDWRRQLTEALEVALGKRRAALLIDIDGFELDPHCASNYSEVAKAVMARFATHVIRFGKRGDLTTASIRTAAVKAKFASNICDSRASAVALLEALRHSELTR